MLSQQSSPSVQAQTYSSSVYFLFSELKIIYEQLKIKLKKKKEVSSCKISSV